MLRGTLLCTFFQQAPPPVPVILPNPIVLIPEHFQSLVSLLRFPFLAPYIGQEVQSMSAPDFFLSFLCDLDEFARETF